MTSERPRLAANPETAWYEQRLRRRRWGRRLFDLMRIVLGLCFLAGGFVALAVHDVVSAALLAPVAVLLLWLGVSDARDTFGPIPKEDVARLRQYERSELFRRARGRLPWQFHGWVRILELVLAAYLFYFATGATIFVAPARRAWANGILFFIFALALIGDALLLKPYRARRLARRSATELAIRLSAGEHTAEASPDPL